MDTKAQVRRFAMELPYLVDGLETTLQVANEHEQWQQFAGAEVNRRLLSAGLTPFPNLRVLAGYELLVKVGQTTRGGRRAYWWMPDREGVDNGLAEVTPGGLRWGSNAVAYVRGYRASHDPFDPSQAHGQIEWHVYRDSDNVLVKTGFAPSVMEARTDCRLAIEEMLA